MNQIRIVIAEDEIWISALIRSILQQRLPEVEVVGEADNGKAALKAILSFTPDIVLADINMPILNGLQMIEQAKAAGAKCKFIIISGHEDFSYAQQALQLGVEDYLLKPIDDDKLCAVIQKTIETLCWERSAKEKLNKNSDLLKEHFFRSLLSRASLSMDECNAANGLQFEPGNYFCAVARISPCRNEGAFAKELLEPFEHDLSLHLKPLCSEAFYFLQGSFLYLFCGYPHTNSKEAQRQITLLFRDLIAHAQAHKAAVTVGFSDEGIDFLQLKTVYLHAKQALAADMGTCSINHYVSGNTDLVYQDKNMPSRQDMSALHRALGNHSSNDLQLWFVQLFDEYVNELRIGNDELLFVLDYTYVLLNIILDAAETAPHRVPFRRQTIFEHLDMCLTVDDLRAQVSNALQNMQAQIETSKSASDLLIKKVLQYIDENLSGAISLEAAAQVVHLTPNYLSEYFKSKTGTNFKDYVLNKRIEHATVLLRKSSRRIQDIAVECGYTDFRHFCKVFKHSTGLTPSEYRRMFG